MTSYVRQRLFTLLFPTIPLCGIIALILFSNGCATERPYSEEIGTAKALGPTVAKSIESSDKAFCEAIIRAVYDLERKEHLGPKAGLCADSRQYRAKLAYSPWLHLQSTYGENGDFGAQAGKNGITIKGGTRRYLWKAVSQMAENGSYADYFEGSYGKQPSPHFYTYSFARIAYERALTFLIAHEIAHLLFDSETLDAKRISFSFYDANGQRIRLTGDLLNEAHASADFIRKHEGLTSLETAQPMYFGTRMWDMRKTFSSRGLEIELGELGSEDIDLLRKKAQQRR